MKSTNLTNDDFLQLEANAAQAKIDNIKKSLCEKQSCPKVNIDQQNSTRVPVVVLDTK